MDLVIKKYKKNDEFKITTLFNDVFKKELSLEYWKWRYDKESEKYINLMWNKNNLVGHYALFPVYLVCNEKTVKSGFSMTTMISSTCRGMGIFSKLAEDIYKDTFNELKIIWGFPNNNSLHGFVKYLDWKHIYDIKMLKLNAYNINKNKIKDSFEVLNIDFFSKDYDKLFLTVISKYKIMVKKNSEYLNWRFIRNPVNKYYILEYRRNGILKGYCVYKMYKEENIECGDIVDVLAIDEETFNKLINKAVIQIANNKGKYVNVWMMDKNFKSILYELGFEESQNITHFGVKKNCEEKDFNDILNINNWYITMSDSDVF